MAVFTTGVVLRLPDTIVAWSPFDTTQLVLLDADVNPRPNKISVCVTLRATYLAVSSRDNRTLHIWSCTTGQRLCSVPCGGHIHHVQLAPTWCVVELAPLEKPQETYMSCFAWLYPNISPVLLRYKHIRNITQMVLDPHIPTLCWFISDMGVFSFDMSLPAHLIAPILVLVDPLLPLWPFTQSYRASVMEHQRRVSIYHALPTQEKEADRATAFLKPQDPTARVLCDYAYTTIAPAYIPQYISSGDTTDTEFCITTQSQAIIIDKQTFKLSLFDIPPYLSLSHICKGMLLLLTTDSEVHAIYYKQGVTGMSIIPMWLDPVLSFTHKVIVPSATPQSCWFHTGANQVFLVGPE